MEITVKARAQFNARSLANDVQILMPVPNDVHTPKFKSGIGSVKYAPEANCVVWKIKQFQGGKEYLMQVGDFVFVFCFCFSFWFFISFKAHFGLSTITQKAENEPRHHPPIAVKFEVPYFTGNEKKIWKRIQVFTNVFLLISFWYSSALFKDC